MTEDNNKNFRKPIQRGKERIRHKKQQYVITHLTEISSTVNIKNIFFMLILPSFCIFGKFCFVIMIDLVIGIQNEEIASYNIRGKKCGTNLVVVKTEQVLFK